MLNKTVLTIVLTTVAIVALIEGAVVYYAFYLTAGTFDLPSYEFTDHNDHIAVTGSWISDNDIGTISFIPTDTTAIECDRIRGTCTEA